MSLRHTGQVIIVGGDFPQASELVILLYRHGRTGPAILSNPTIFFPLKYNNVKFPKKCLKSINSTIHMIQWYQYFSGPVSDNGYCIVSEVINGLKSEAQMISAVKFCEAYMSGSLTLL